MKRTPLTVARAQSVLFAIWVGAAIIIFGLFLGQTLNGKFGESASQAWGWLVPNLAPSLALMTTGFLSSILAPDSDDRIVSKTVVFWAAVACSLFYVFSIIVIIVVEPRLQMDTFDVYRDSSLALGAAQSLSASLLAAFFLTGSDAGVSPRLVAAKRA